MLLKRGGSPSTPPPSSQQQQPHPPPKVHTSVQGAALPAALHMHVVRQNGTAWRKLPNLNVLTRHVASKHCVSTFLLEGQMMITISLHEGSCTPDERLLCCHLVLDVGVPSGSGVYSCHPWECLTAGGGQSLH